MSKVKTLAERVGEQERARAQQGRRAQAKDEAAKKRATARNARRRRLTVEPDGRALCFRGRRGPGEGSRIAGTLLPPMLSIVVVAFLLVGGLPTVPVWLGWAALVLAWLLGLHLYRVEWTLRIDGDAFSFRPGFHPFGDLLTPLATREQIGRLSELSMNLYRPVDAAPWAILHVRRERWEEMTGAMSEADVEVAEILEGLIRS